MLVEFGGKGERKENRLDGYYLSLCGIGEEFENALEPTSPFYPLLIFPANERE